MTATARLLEQRSVGLVRLRVEAGGVAVLREAGAAKVRLPRGTNEAILINTGGGLAGGDAMAIEAEAGPGARLTLTTQAAERVYRTLGPSATVSATLAAEAGARLHWLPQETILFDGAALSRTFTVNLAADAGFLAVESIVLGRTEMGEAVRRVELRDTWRIHREGRLVHADTLAISGPPPVTPATLNGAAAFATIVLIADRAAAALEDLRALIGAGGGASSWNGKLVARLVAADGFHLRQRLIPALSLLAGSSALPRVWTF